MINYPKEIYEYVKGLKAKVDDVGRSSDLVITFSKMYVLKVSTNITLLKREYDINEWLFNKIPSSKNILFVVEGDKAYYLRTYIDGDSLISDRYLSNPNLLVTSLTKAVKALRSLDKYDIKINSLDSVGNSFTHGDLCLPNIYFDKNNNFIGFIDLGSGGAGDEWSDYAWMLWSLEYNLKTDKYNNMLLNNLNIPLNKSKYEYYIPEDLRHKHYEK